VNASVRGSARHYLVALRALLILTVALGIAYPFGITAIAQAAMPAQANGSLTSLHGKVVGSALIGQSFSRADGTAIPGWFQPRPSAAGDGYDALASGGSNLAGNNPELSAAENRRAAAIEKAAGVFREQIPADALTASASGLDPHISPAYALLQVHGVAVARGMNEAQVRRLVTAKIQGRDLGYLGEPTVNVLELNIALARLDPAGNK
jgi:K+-transporting ATPase ATPase C chain